MDSYFTSMALLGLRDQNLPPFKEARIRRYKSIKKMVNLIDTAGKTCPAIPLQCFSLDPFDPEWDDMMTYPVIQYNKYFYLLSCGALNLFFYAYNYNNLTYNIRLKNIRYYFPIVNFALFTYFYSQYKTEVLKVNLFDEYISVRAQELVKQNEYLWEHEDVKRFVWWYEDLKDTLMRVHRQANNHEASDFADSEIILQDFIRRYAPNKLDDVQAARMI